MDKDRIFELEKKQEINRLKLEKARKRLRRLKMIHTSAENNVSYYNLKDMRYQEKILMTKQELCED